MKSPQYLKETKLPSLHQRLQLNLQMNTKLIVDAGSTKVEWVLLGRQGAPLARILSHGINALMATPVELDEAIGGISPQFPAACPPEEITYYGAGCATREVCAKIKEALTHAWPDSTAVDVHSDLLGACRGLLGDSKGIVCILGTGSNSCYYNGSGIEMNVPSLGYILGDEGSGAALGKRLVADAFKGHLPKPVRDKFMSFYELTLDSILDYTYRRPGANRFLASLVPFIKDHIWNPYLYSLVLEEFISFFKRNVAMYPGSHSLPLVFTGSVAHHFSDILAEAADRQGFKIKAVEKNPLDGLIKYHSRS